MTESKLFVSSCNRRELARRRNRSRLATVVFRPQPALLGLACAVIGVAAFFAGRGGI